MTDHRVLCAVLRLERIDFSVIQRQPPSDRKSLSLLAVLLKADSIQCLLTDGCSDETYFNWFRDENRREVVCLARMQIFDASTADGFVEGRLAFGPSRLRNGRRPGHRLRLKSQRPRGTPSDVKNVALTINCHDHSTKFSRNLKSYGERSFEASCFH